MSSPESLRSASVLGCRVDALDSAQAVRRIVALATGEQPSLVVTLGTEMVVRAQNDQRFRDIVNTAALSLCDTVGVKVAARGARIPERVSGIDLVDPLCAELAAAQIPVYLVGGKGDTAARAAAILEQRHPGLRVAGVRDGYFPGERDAEVARAVAGSGARVILAGLGSPRQEFWLHDHLYETGCSVGIGVGGSFDVIAGNVARAPLAWRRMNAEWLYRLIKEPGRWRRQLALPRFVMLALGERIGAGSARRST